MKSQKIKQNSSKTWTVIINIILILFILVGILIAISLIPSKKNYKILAVMSGSMEPAIKTGSIIVIKPIDEYKEGNVITFQSGVRKNEYTTHRIQKIEEKDGARTYTTKGDANKESDTETISKDKIVGKKLFTLPFLGYILGYTKTLPGLMLIIIVPAVIIIYEEINKIKSEASKLISKRRELKKVKNGNKSKKS